MIDIEYPLFDTFQSQLSVLHPEANITAGYDEKRVVSPTVIFRETGNVPYQRGNTDDCAENFTRLTIEIEVVSDKVGTARSECKVILNDSDAIMQSMKFRRIYKSRPLNLNRNEYRQYARYEVIVGKPVTVDGNTVYQMYRR